MKRYYKYLWIALLLSFATYGWISNSSNRPTAQVGVRRDDTDGLGVTRPGSPSIDSCAIIRIEHTGSEPVDREIREWQSRLTNRTDIQPVVERLGWLFVSKARSASDPGFYKLAEQAASCIETMTPGAPEALLLRGHVLHNLHRFHEAKPLAEQLVARRGIATDYGLLGDVRLEIGELESAIEAYQTMMDLQPGPAAYVRGAQVRWLTGDLAGAMELITMAAHAGGQDREANAWAYTRLATFQLISGDLTDAARSCEAALQLHPESPSAHAMLARTHLATGNFEAAVRELKVAESIQSLPETQWLLLEALRQAGRSEDVPTVLNRLTQVGESQDQRTFALFLASENLEPERALELAKLELNVRADVHTHDTLAWAYFSAGQLDLAAEHSRLAVRHQTADPRLAFHAAAIAAKRGDQELAERYGKFALEHLTALFPSEVQRLFDVLTPEKAAKVAPKFLPEVPVLPRPLDL